MLALKEEIDKQALGTIMHAEAAFSHDKLINVPKGDWRTQKAVAPAAGMTGMGIHLTDLLISFFGRVETVQSMTASRTLGWETGDVVTVQLGFEAGMTATLSAILHTPHFIRMHVFGSEKWIEVLNDSHPDTPDGIVRVLTAKTGHPIEQKEYPWSDAVTANLEAFAAAAQGLAPYPFTLDQMRPQYRGAGSGHDLRRRQADRRGFAISKTEDRKLPGPSDHPVLSSPSLSALHGLPHFFRCRRHVDMANADRIANRSDHRGRRADGADLTLPPWCPADWSVPGVGCLARRKEGRSSALGIA